MANPPFSLPAPLPAPKPKIIENRGIGEVHRGWSRLSNFDGDMLPPARPPVEGAAAGETVPLRELRPPGRFAQPCPPASAQIGVLSAPTRNRKPRNRPHTPLSYMPGWHPTSIFTSMPFLSPGKIPAWTPPGLRSSQKFFKKISLICRRR
jgi:hypothetical protein